MSDTTHAFDFSQFVPGFDFLKNLTSPAASGGAGAVPGMPSLSSWVAPTLSVEEVEKRIQELKAVQYWLEQNGHALRATIQALEVQKMTLSTLRGMNVHMEDLANAFTRSANPAAEPATAAHVPRAAPAPAPKPTAAPVAAANDEDEGESEGDAGVDAKPAAQGSSKADSAAGVVDPMQWWGALTQQFQHIASSALQEAAKLGAPPDATKKAAAPEAPTGAAAKKAPKKKAPARKAARKRAAPKG